MRNYITRNAHPSQLIKLSESPSVSDCVRYMATSMDMLDWNNKRREIIRKVSFSVFCNEGKPSNDSYVSLIDCSNLASETMKRNQKRRDGVHKPFTYLR